jgi:hypothetical protein
MEYEFNTISMKTQGLEANGTKLSYSSLEEREGRMILSFIDL